MCNLFIIVEETISHYYYIIMEISLECFLSNNNNKWDRKSCNSNRDVSNQAELVASRKVLVTTSYNGLVQTNCPTCFHHKNVIFHLSYVGITDGNIWSSQCLYGLFNKYDILVI